MSSVSRIMTTSPERVWEALSDGWLYPLWVVGASRIRDVDASWPEVGACIHHSVGLWPLVIDDETTVLESAAGQMLRITAKAQPLGAAEVTITLTPRGAHTDVTLDERPVSGPGVAVPERLIAPVLNFRNGETLRRLAFLAEGRPESILPSGS